MTDADIKKIEKLLAGMPEWDNLTWGQSKSLHAAVPQMRAILARLKAAEQDLADARHGPGVGRGKDCVTALEFYFNRPVTDEEMRFLHEVMQRAVASIPSTPNLKDGRRARHTRLVYNKGMRSIDTVQS